MSAEQGIIDFLYPVLDTTRRVFPDAHRVQVLLEEDPELVGDRHIVFEVAVSPEEVSRSAERHWQWSRELFDVCPATHVCLFGLHVAVGNPAVWSVDCPR
jgi:hypothetical protein